LSSDKKSFMREWGVLVVFGVLAVGALIGFRLWTEHAADEPVSDAYRAYLGHVAERSKSANEYLEGYYRKHTRQTVASRHFEVVCGAMTVLADRDGVNPEEFSVQMARACRMFQKGGVTGDLP